MQCITHGLLRHVHDELWLMSQLFFVLEASLSEQCLMPMLSLKNSDKVSFFFASKLIFWTYKHRGVVLHGFTLILYTWSSLQLIWFYVYIEYTAEGLEIGNSVYWIRFGEEYSQKVILLLLLQVPSPYSFLFFFRS